MPALQPFHYFLMIVIGQGVFLAIVLFAHQKGDPKANRLLSLVVLLMTHFSFVFFLNDSGLRQFLPILFVNGFSITPLIPVFFYIYLRRLSGDPVGKNALPHLIPFMLQFLYWFPNNTNGLVFALSEETIEQYYPLVVVRAVGGIHMMLFVAYWVAISRLPFDLPRNSWIYTIRTLYGLLSMIFVVGLFSLWITDTQYGRYHRNN